MPSIDAKKKLRGFAKPSIGSVVALTLLTGAAQAGWFSSEKYDCENPAVIEEAKNLIACQGLLRCKEAGFADLQEIVSSSPSKITSIMEELRKKQLQDVRSRMTNPTEAEAAWGQRYINKVADDQLAIVLAFQNLFLDARSFTDDLNPSVSKYSCRLVFRYNPAVFLPLWDFYLRLQYANDPTLTAARTEELRKNPNSDLLEVAVIAALNMNAIAQKAQQRTVATARFTVQPSTEKDFLIDVRNLPFPGKQ